MFSGGFHGMSQCGQGGRDTRFLSELRPPDGRRHRGTQPGGTLCPDPTAEPSYADSGDGSWHSYRRFILATVSFLFSHHFVTVMSGPDSKAQGDRSEQQDFQLLLHWLYLR
jgi:hypothetical protein